MCLTPTPAPPRRPSASRRSARNVRCTPAKNASRSDPRLSALRSDKPVGAAAQCCTSSGANVDHRLYGPRESVINCIGIDGGSDDHP